MRYRLYRHLLKEAYVSNTSILFTLTWQKICEKSYTRSAYVIFVLIFTGRTHSFVLYKFEFDSLFDLCSL